MQYSLRFVGYDENVYWTDVDQCNCALLIEEFHSEQYVQLNRRIAVQRETIRRLEEELRLSNLITMARRRTRAVTTATSSFEVARPPPLLPAPTTKSAYLIPTTTSAPLPSSISITSSSRSPSPAPLSSPSQTPTPMPTTTSTAQQTSSSESALQETKNPNKRKRNGRVVCVICGETYSRTFGLTRHMQREHSDQRYECQHCSLIFYCKHNLKQHLNRKLCYWFWLILLFLKTRESEREREKSTSNAAIILSLSLSLPRLVDSCNWFFDK